MISSSDYLPSIFYIFFSAIKLKSWVLRRKAQLTRFNLKIFYNQKKKQKKRLKQIVFFNSHFFRFFVRMHNFKKMFFKPRSTIFNIYSCEVDKFSNIWSKVCREKCTTVKKKNSQFEWNKKRGKWEPRKYSF